MMMNNVFDSDAVRRNLQDAGCNGAEAQSILNQLVSGETAQGLRSLAGHRRRLLESLHMTQKRIDCLDYLVWQVQQREKNGGSRSE